MIKAACLFLMAVCLMACSGNADKIPKDVLPKEKMEAVLWDYISADLYVKNVLAKDSSTNIKDEAFRLQEKVFAKNNIDRNTFTKSYNWYEAHDAVFMPMLDSISAKQGRNLEKERNANRSSTQ